MDLITMNYYNISDKIKYVPLHNHYLFLYSTPKEQYPVIMPFIASAFAKNEKCVIIEENINRRLIVDKLENEVDKKASEKNKLETIDLLKIVNNSETQYEKLIGLIKQIYLQSVDEKFTALKLVLEINFELLQNNFDLIKKFEAGLQELVTKNNITIICKCNKQKQTAEMLKCRIASHPFIIYDNFICNNHYYVPYEEEMSENQPEKEINRYLDNILHCTKLEEELRSNNKHISIMANKQWRKIFKAVEDIQQEKKEFEREIAQLKLSKSLVEEQSRQNRSMITSMKNGFAYLKIITDAKEKPIDAIFLDLNDNFESLTEFLSKDVIGKKVSEVIPYIQEADFDWLKICGNVALKGKPAKFKYYSKSLDKWFFVNVYSPKKRFFAAIFEDITEQHYLIEKLKYHSAVIENISNAIISTDLDFIIKSWNKSAEGIYGFKEHEVIGKSIPETTGIEYPYNDEEEVLKEFFANGRWEGEVLQKNKNGDSLIIHSTVSLIKNDNGEPVGIVGVNKDITELKNIEHNLLKQKEFTERILQISPVSILSTDKNGVVTFVNDKAEKVLELKEKTDLIGKKYNSWEQEFKDSDGKLLPENKSPFCIVQERLEPVYDIRHYLRLPNGETILLSTNATPLFDENNQFDGMVAVIKNITGKCC